MSEIPQPDQSEFVAQTEVLQRQIDAEKAAQIGSIIFGPTIEIELPTQEQPKIGDSLPSETPVDKSNVAQGYLDAMDAGEMSAPTKPEKVQSQIDEAWDNHLGAGAGTHAEQARAEVEAAYSEIETEAEAQIEDSMKDKLTGLKNREALELLVSKTGVEGISGVALVDLNDFKGANDNFGHRRGDEVLQRFAELAQKRLAGDEKMPGSDLGEIFRTGGDEFAIAFYGGRKREDIEQAISDIELGTSQISFGPQDEPLPEAKRTSWTAGASIGFAPSNEFHDLSGGLAIADQDMFARKEASRPEGYVGREPNINVEIKPANS
ncbi:GGDEF domain-containing protein [Candidatus Saccharibacteria bacterium]|nr:GGDEF domain-containing protein [Candidatus Saccharibacteria bacterium]